MERTGLWERLRHVSPVVWDGLLAASMLTIAILVARSGGDARAGSPADRPLDLVGSTLIVAGTAPLALRRRAPSSVLGIVALATIAYAVAGYRGDLAPQLAIAVYTVAAHEDRSRVAWFGVPVALVAGGVVQASIGSISNWVEVGIGLVFIVAIPVGIGRAVFARRRRLVLERERAAADAVTAERARIAREMHDVVAHSMSVMVVQAGAARVTVDRDPAEAKEALRRIEHTGRLGLDEMRRLIVILTADGDRDDLAPQPGLAQLDRLLETMRGAGLAVESVVEGDPMPLPLGIDLTAFRIVQEGLTNVLKHAGRAAAVVRVRYLADSVEVEVEDDGRGPPVGGAQGHDWPGHGLIGMRERVALFDGQLQAEGRPGGGFLVRAHLPIAVEAAP